MTSETAGKCAFPLRRKPRRVQRLVRHRELWQVRTRKPQAWQARSSAATAIKVDSFEASVAWKRWVTPLTSQFRSGRFGREASSETVLENNSAWT